jgi:hypothetical protein
VHGVAMSASPWAGTRRVSATAVTIVVCIALGAVAAAMASLNVALPGLAQSTQASQTQLEWIIDAYSLIFAALLLPATCARAGPAAAGRAQPGRPQPAGRSRAGRSRQGAAGQPELVSPSR